jgi:hypothetical protein
MSLDLVAIRKRLDALPDPECKWKREGLTVLDIRDRDILEVTSYLSPGEVADFCANAPEDIGLLLAEVERLRRERDDSYRLFNEVVETLRSAGLDQTSPPGTRLWKAAVNRIQQLQRERDEALARWENRLIDAVRM